jgi:hypothetical protein
MAKKNKPGVQRRQQNNIRNRERRKQIAIQAGNAFLADPDHIAKLMNAGPGFLDEVCDRLGFPNVDTLEFVLSELFAKASIEKKQGE